MDRSPRSIPLRNITRNYPFRTARDSWAVVVELMLLPWFVKRLQRKHFHELVHLENFPMLELEE